MYPTLYSNIVLCPSKIRRKYFKRQENRGAQRNIADNFRYEEIQVLMKRDYELEVSEILGTLGNTLGHCFIRASKSFGEFYFFHRYRNCFDSRTDMH